MDSSVDFAEDIVAYLRERRGQLVAMMTMVGYLTRRIKLRAQSRQIRGRIMTDLSELVKAGKVVRYRKITMVRRKPRSSQGLLRLSELA